MNFLEANKIISEPISDMVGSKEAVGHAISTIKSIEENTPNWVNKLHKRWKGCEVVPKKAQQVFVYFVRPRENQWYDVVGYMLNEKDKIIDNIYEGFSFMIFYSKDMTDYGFKPIASGTMLDNEYFSSNMGQLIQIRNNNPEYAFLSCRNDVKYLERRFDVVGFRGVYTDLEIAEIISEYEGLTRHQQMGKGNAIYQAVVDLGMASCK